LNVEISGVSNSDPGRNPTVRFRVGSDDGTPLTDLSGLNRLAFTASGPTTDYTEMLGSTAVGGGAGGTLVGPDAEGFFDYTTSFAIPEDAGGTWAIGAEARRPVMLTRPDDAPPITVNEASENAVVTFDVGSEMPLVRRMVVGDANCESCHGVFSRDFSIHGNLRNRVEYCVICHNPNQSDVSRRRNDAEAVARGDDTASIDFKVMIHKIHRGEELANHPYIIYGFGPAPANFTIHDFAEVLFPGDLRNCEKCHLEGTQLLPPFPGTALGTQVAHLDPETGAEVVDGRLGPVTSVCTSCHDGDAAVAHADTQTASDGGEACSVCHAEGRSEAVSEVHAR
jgi:OmcA/MtrC family decaheme c-type cytochrome